MELNALNLEFSKKQLEFIKNATHHWNGKIGATQCGKTYIDTFYVIPMRIIERLGKAGIVFILGVSKGTIERNILEPMREIWGRDLVGEINNENKVFLFGEICYALGTEKVSQVAKFRGARAKYIYWDELCDANEDVFNLIKTRLSFEYSCCDFTGNPKQPTHFVKKFIDTEGLDLYYQHWTLFDNPFLPKSYVENVCAELRGTVFYDRYVLGMWKRAEGSIYRYFCDHLDEFLIDEAPPLSKISTGIDFGGNKSAQAFCSVGYTHGFGELVVFRATTFKDKTLKPDELNNSYVKYGRIVYNKFRQAFNTYYDNAEVVLGNGIRDACLRDGLATDVRPAKKINIIDRIRLTLSLMGTHKIKIVKKDCEVLIKAFQEAVWDDKHLEDVRLDDGTYCVDILDAFEYAIERDKELIVRMTSKG